MCEYREKIGCQWERFRLLKGQYFYTINTTRLEVQSLVEGSGAASLGRFIQLVLLFLRLVLYLSPLVGNCLIFLTFVLKYKHASCFTQLMQCFSHQFKATTGQMKKEKKKTVLAFGSNPTHRSICMIVQQVFSIVIEEWIF